MLFRSGNMMNEFGFAYMASNFQLRFLSFSNNSIIDVTPPASFYSPTPPMMEGQKIVYSRVLADGVLFQQYDLTNSQRTDLVKFKFPISNYIITATYRNKRLLIHLNKYGTTDYDAFICQL